MMIKNGAITMSHRPLIQLKTQGNAFDCGVQYGQQSIELIKLSLDTYRRMFSVCQIDWSTACAKAQAHLPGLQTAVPHLVEELRGIAQGSQIDFDSLLALNCRTEILPSDFLVRALDTELTNDERDTHLNECTSLSFKRDDADTWLSQNWDWVGLQRNALVVNACKPEQAPEYITVTEAGMLAKIGINSHGLGVCLNILRSNNDGQTVGMPVHFLLRAVLECETVAQVKRMVAGYSFTSSSNVLVADASGDMASLELSPSGSRIIEPDNDGLCHTNHFINKEFSVNDAGFVGNESTTKRLERASTHIGALCNLADIKHLLSNTEDGVNSICKFADESFPEIAQIETVVGVVMNLNSRELWVSAAQPSISDFTRYAL